MSAAEEAFWFERAQALGQKGAEGWDMHRRGFPYSALMSLPAKEGWIMRNRLYPQDHTPSTKTSGSR